MPTNTSVTQVGPDETPVVVSQGGNVYNAESFDKIVPCVRRAIHNGSGGQQLENAEVGKIVIRNGSGNNPMFVGGVGNLAPFSGRGLTLYANETFTAPVKNMNAISVMATISGEYIECVGFTSGPEPTMDVSGIFIAPDETAPVISGVVPISGISGAEIDSIISVEFSECMNPLTVTTTEWTVRISGSSVNVSGIVSADSQNCAQFYFTPYSGNISGAQMYVARIAGGVSGVRDVAGNPMTTSGRWHWTTVSGIPPDITLPRISGSNPSSGQIGTDPTLFPNTIQFSEQMQSGSINSTNIQVLLSGIALPITVELDTDLRTALVDASPGTDLENNKAYYMTVYSGGVKDLAGNAISGTYTISYFTADGAWNQVYTATTASDTNMGGNPWRVGHRIMSDFKDEVFVKVRVHLSQIGSSQLSGRASGLVVQLRKGSDNSVIHFTRPFSAFFDAKNDMSGITSPSPFDFYNSDNMYAAQIGDTIEVQYLSGTSVEVGYANSNVNNGVIWTQYTGGTYSGAAYSNISSRDLGGILWAR